MKPIHPATLVNGTECPACQSIQTKRNGTYQTIPIYKCKHCGKTFRATQGTAIQGIHKRQQFLQYAQCIQDGMTIRQAAKHIGISIATSFAWRHKHLAAQSKTSQKLTAKLLCIAIEETPYSAKGQKKACENPKLQPATKTVTITTGNNEIVIQKIENAQHLKQILKEHSETTTLVISERKTAFSKILRKKAVGTAKFETTLHKQLLQQTEKLKSNLRIWLERFRGVASKYLQQYWDWYVADQIGQTNIHQIQWNINTNTNACSNFSLLQNSSN